MIKRFVIAATVLPLCIACGGGNSPIQKPIIPDQARDLQESGVAVDAETDDPPGQFSNDEGDTPPDAPVPVASRFAETLALTDQETITLTGIGILTDAGIREIVVRDGTYVAADQTQILADTSFALTNEIPGAFLNTTGFVQEKDGIFGIVGIPTALEDMPTGQSATFTGSASGFVIVGDAGIDLINGISTVTVNFEDGMVTAEMSDFEAISQITGDARAGLFETLTLRGATITETGFSGGILETSGGDSVDAIIGDNARLLSRGQFFGYDLEADLPDEIGGLVYSEGDTGQIFGSFSAD